MAVAVPRDAAFTACSCAAFADQLAASGPYECWDSMLAAARRIWWQGVPVTGWLEAFAAHPRIGEAAPRAQPATEVFQQLSHAEQAAARASTSASVSQQLAALNAQYAAKFGHIFIICAAGKSSEFMLEALRARLPNPPHLELANAAKEQMKITEARLATLLLRGGPPPPAPTPAERAAVRTGALAAHLAPPAAAAAAAADAPAPPLRSPITTHVLDTALGVPAAGLRLSLHRLMEGSSGAAWDTLAAGTTNADGRVGDLLPPARTVAPGRYQMRFDTGPYLAACHAAHPAVFAPVPFYQEAVVDFTITPAMAADHFHIPLLLSPYGFSTYKGS